MKTKAYVVLLAGSTLWCAAIFAAPAFGLNWVYEFFSHVCHQDPARSWRLFGTALPVCIRCASIYFAFAASLWLGFRTNARWLRTALALMALEFAVARLLVDAAALRAISGILIGLSAAPFVRQGIEELGESM